jgi:hypothetical protein
MDICLKCFKGGQERKEKHESKGIIGFKMNLEQRIRMIVDSSL